MQNKSRLDLSYGLSASQVADILRHAADQIGDHRRVLAFYLVDMEDRRLYQVSGHGCTVHFGDAQLDLEPRRTREYVQVGRALQDLVCLDEAFLSGEISWSKVVALLPVVQRDTQTAWVEYAKDHTFRELRAEVGGCRAGDLPGEGTSYGLIHKLNMVKAGLCDESYRMFETARMYFSMDPLKLLTDGELIEDLLRRVLYGIPEPVKTVEPTPEPKPRNDEELPAEDHAKVLRRDENRCRNCHNHLDVEVHT